MSTAPTHEEMQRLSYARAIDLGLFPLMEMWMPGAGYADLVIFSDFNESDPLAVVEFKTGSAGQSHGIGQVHRYQGWFRRRGFGHVPAILVIPGFDYDRWAGRLKGSLVATWDDFRDLAMVVALYPAFDIDAVSS